MNLKFTNPILPIGEIKIPEEFSPPRLEKLKKCMDFYRANGYFDRQIIVDSVKVLHDGYCAYLVAYLLDVKKVGVLMVLEQVEQVKAIPPAKPEPVKLYCVKSFRPGAWFTKGKMYAQDPDGRFTWDDGYRSGFDPEDTMDDVHPMSEFLVRLVQRPAKVGEYIVVMDEDGFASYDRRYDLHDLLQVTEDDSNIIDQWKGKAVGFKNITHPDRPFQHCVILNENYLVLDGYKGEAE